MLQVLSGPAGAGKSGYLRRRLRPADVLIDFGVLFVALAGQERDEAGRFPERVEGDPRLLLVAWLRTAAIRQARERELSGWITTSDGRRDVLDRLQGLAGADRLHVLDPGEATVRERLRRSQPGRGGSCRRAVDRWYRHYTPAPSDVRVTE